MNRLTPVQQSVLTAYRGFLAWATDRNLNRAWPTPDGRAPAWVHDADRCYRSLMFAAGLPRFRWPIATDEGFIGDIII